MQFQTDLKISLKNNNMDPLELAFITALMEVENGPKVGWDESKGLWFPHKSPEGGYPTIAYGHKIKNDSELTLFNEGISQKIAMEVFLGDYLAAKKEAQKSWKFHFKNKGYPDRYEYVLTDIVFNTGYLTRNGSWRWPKLAQAIIDQNDQEVYQESIRWYTTPGGVKKPLTRRSIVICRALGLDFQP